MRKAVFAILALGLATTVVYAQTDTTPPAQPQSPAAAEQGAAPPPPPPGPDAMHGPNGMRGPGHHGPGGWQKHHGMMMGSKAAHFRIRSGDTMIDVKCAAADTTAACGETVMQLLDKLQADQRADEDQSGDDSTMNE